MSLMRTILLLVFLVGCTHDVTVEDVTEACVERSGEAYRADCVDYAESYSDCLPEALALVLDDCEGNREELAACAR